MSETKLPHTGGPSMIMFATPLNMYLSFRLDFYRAMHFSAKRGIAIACGLCLSVRL